MATIPVILWICLTRLLVNVDCVQNVVGNGATLMNIQWSSVQSRSHSFLATPTEEDIQRSGTYGGVKPLAYAVRLKLPVPTNRWTMHRNSYGGIEGQISMRFRVHQPTQRVLLNVRKINLANARVRMIIEDRTDGPNFWDKHEPISEASTSTVELMSVEKYPDELLMVTVRSVLPANDNTNYTLIINGYSAGVNGPYDMGVFAGLAYSIPTGRVFTYTSQLQADWARSLFPCVDHPRFKTTFTTAIVHPPHYNALSSAPIDNVKDGVNDENGWKITSFEKTPLLPAYTYGIALLPSTGFRILESQPDWIPIRFHYNSYVFSDLVAEKLHSYCAHSWQSLRVIFPHVSLPLQKLDFVSIPGFKVQGMENWALITLNERYLITSNEALRLSLIAHEVTHQWISNFVTIRTWEHLCLQEGLTDHYARRVVNQYFGDNSNLWEYYIVDKYLVSTQQETNRIPPIDLFVSVKPTMDEVGSRCFGKSVFLVDSLAALVGRARFDASVEQFLNDRRYEHFDLNGFVSHFRKITLGVDRTTGQAISAGMYFDRWFRLPGYPSLLVTRNYANRTVTIEQRGLFPKANGYATTFARWPIVVQLRGEHSGNWTDGPNQSNHSLFTGDRIEITNRAERDNDWIMLNERFVQFVRVNYDDHNWMLLATALRREPRDFDVLDRVRLVHDFCFFNTIGLIRDGANIRRRIIEAIAIHPSYFPNSYIYSSTCHSNPLV